MSGSARYALVAGGGTGGHLMPVLAVARALAAGGPERVVEIVGSRRGLDAAVLEEAGLPVTLLPGRGLLRRGDLRSLASNAAALGDLARALVLALVLVARRRPEVVVAVGGYASVPVALAAAVLAVPVVLVNLDVRPGAANRLVGRFARAAAVAFPGTALPRAVVTGAPLRPEVVAVARPTASDRASARRKLGLDEQRRTILAVGGSLGARRLNDAVVELARRWAERADLSLYHVVGRRDFATATAAWASSAPAHAPGPHGPGLCYRQVEFEQHMELVYQAADLVVSRAGAATVAELAAVGLASVLVPLPGAPGDHQRANAQVLVNAGGAVVLPDDECDGERLARVAGALLESPRRLQSMADGAASVGRPDALEAVVSLVERHARGRR